MRLVLPGPFSLIAGEGTWLVRDGNGVAILDTLATVDDEPTPFDVQLVKLLNKTWRDHKAPKKKKVTKR